MGNIMRLLPRRTCYQKERFMFFIHIFSSQKAVNILGKKGSKIETVDTLIHPQIQACTLHPQCDKQPTKKIITDLTMYIF